MERVASIPIQCSKNVCWACKSKTRQVFKLPQFPLTGRFPKKNEPSLSGDLTFSVCQSCKLIQLEEAYSPKDLYSEYYYRSSINNTMRQHLANMVIDIINEFKFKGNGNYTEIYTKDNKS